MPDKNETQARSSIPALQRQIDDIRAGRASSLNLAYHIIHERLTQVPHEIRGLEGLRKLDLGNNQIDTLPPWLGDLPHLEKISTLGRPMLALPLLPNIQWGVEAETIIRCSNELDPANVYAIAIRPGTSSKAMREVFDLGRRRTLRLSKLLIERTITSNEIRASAEAKWTHLDLLNSQVDEFLESQPSLSWLALFGYPLGRIPEAIRELQALKSLCLVRIQSETFPDWLFERPH